MEDPMALLVADLYEAAGLSRRLGERIAKAEGQTQARWQVLSVVSDGPRTVPQAARRLGTARQAVQRVVGELVREGMLEARDNPDHRTSPLYGLTGPGSDVLQRMNAAAEREHQIQMEQITPAEIAELRAGLRRLTAVLATR
jgi:DNA-binding MarR family transcriptional regulator